MSSNPWLDNFQNQAASLDGVLQYQLGEGAAAIRSAASAIGAARRVVFTGMGTSLFACVPSARLLEENGKQAEAIEASELLYYRGRTLSPDTVVFLVSRSGATAEILKLLPLVRESGARAIGITNEPESALAAELPETLLVHSAPDHLVAIQTYTGTVAALLLLAGAAIDGVLDGWRGISQTLVKAVAAATDRAMEDPGWEAFLSQCSAVYLLGRGASLGSVREGVLLFHETARAPAVGMSVAQFRHGAVEVADERLRALIFASQERTREYDLGVALDLERLGAQVRICPTHGVKEPFGPVTEIIPVQTAAYRLARSRGLTGAEFRTSTLVTATEVGF